MAAAGLRSRVVGRAAAPREARAAAVGGEARRGSAPGPSSPLPGGGRRRRAGLRASPLGDWVSRSPACGETPRCEAAGLGWALPQLGATAASRGSQPEAGRGGLGSFPPHRAVVGLAHRLHVLQQELFESSSWLRDEAVRADPEPPARKVSEQTRLL